MWMSGEFRTDLAEKTDGQLYGALAHAEDYIPEAIEAVRVELHRRNLAPERGAQLEASALATKAQETAMASKPLQGSLKVLIIFEPLVALFVVAYYMSRGYQTRVEQCWCWLGYGLVRRLGLVALAVFR